MRTGSAWRAAIHDIALRFWRSLGGRWRSLWFTIDGPLCSFWRRLLAGIVVANHLPRRTGDFHAIIAIRLKAVAATQRANPAGFAAYCIERIDAGDLNVEFGSGVFIESFKRASGVRGPFVLGVAGITADSAQLGLQ